MRTTISLDDDVHELARHYANGRGITLSAAINEVMRQVTDPPEPSSRVVRGANGMLVLASTGRKITPEMVKHWQEDEI